MKKPTLIAVAIVSTAFILSFLLFPHEKNGALQTDVLTGGSPLPRFVLTGTDGGKVGLESFRGKVVLIFFGYANCPDLCPMALKRYAELEKLLGPKSSDVVFILITTDPSRDTPEALARFVAKFSPHIVALTGEWDELAEVWTKYHIRPLEKDENASFIAHSVVIYVGDRNLVLRKILTPEMPADAMLKEILPLF
ncbi:MAG: SCO family protein [Candidatus Caldarchaeum sp.]|jgi:protein SCO1/2